MTNRASETASIGHAVQWLQDAETIARAVRFLQDARDRAATELPPLKVELIGVIDTREKVPGLEIVGSVFSYAFATLDYADLLLWDIGEENASRSDVEWEIAREVLLTRPPLDKDRLDALIEQERAEALRRLRRDGAGTTGVMTEATTSAVNAACDAARDCVLGCAALRQLAEQLTPATEKDALQPPAPPEPQAKTTATPQDVAADIVLTLADPKPDPTRVAYSLDCRCVNWYGTVHHFTPTQAACVKVLIEHYKHAVPDVGESTILTSEWVDSSQQRLVSVFDNGQHPAWGTMIKPGSTKGTYRLAKPGE